MPNWRPVLKHPTISKCDRLAFVALTEEEHEIAISYWHEKSQLESWKMDPEHLVAHNLG